MSLTWADLQEQAKKILENLPVGEFSDRSFATQSGGAPENRVRVPEIHRSEEAKYTTVRNGTAYSGQVVVRCRVTGAVDSGGRPIYEAENGCCFVYRYHGGSAYDFDRGVLDTPTLAANAH